jgi:hypothetical protein
LPPAEPEVTLHQLNEMKRELQKEFNDQIKDEIKPKLTRLSDTIKE